VHASQLHTDSTHQTQRSLYVDRDDLTDDSTPIWLSYQPA